MTNRLKGLILKRAREYGKTGIDIDGDIVIIFGKAYYVNIINDEVEEIK